MLNTHFINKKNASIFTVWLFHLSALIGIYLGHFDWFIAKTPINLLVLSALLVLNFPIDTPKKLGIAAVFFFAGMAIEWVGVHYGFLFGEYVYGANLGIKIDGVPLLIGVNWALLTFASAAIAARIFRHPAAKILFGAALMVFLDLFIEVAAPPLDFWIWTLGDAPLRNYVSWFGFAALFHLIYHRSRIKGDFTFSLHLYLAQLVFFAYFFGVYRL
ncbi:MAG: carotenoid biosynthesis protein [Lewinellaceae bacterium]|nr:carotenoid biosynthesis protein [Lewinellaceae bacterium]